MVNALTISGKLINFKISHFEYCYLLNKLGKSDKMQGLIVSYFFTKYHDMAINGYSLFYMSVYIAVHKV